MNTPLTANSIIPRPASITPGEGHFLLGAASAIYLAQAGPELRALGEALAARLRPATGFELPIRDADTLRPGDLRLSLEPDAAPGEEGYALTITPETVTLAAARPAGLFYAIQTLAQLLPPAIESDSPQPGPWPILAVIIRDQPRFAWRGAMLDVARHFFGPAEVKRYIDQLARYKINRLHLHLTDDQGWRLEIKRWPRLAEHSGASAVGGDPGGYYTQAEYRDLVEYALSRQITLVPEVDLPGHTHAALAAYPELSCDGQARSLYTGIEVGFSTLCVDKEITYRFLEDVLGEMADLTPGAYLHIGGDEAAATPPEAYARFWERVQPLVCATGKQLVGWEEIGQVRLLPGACVQLWTGGHARAGLAQGARVILSPAQHTYLDMKYTPETGLGLNWAGHVEVRDAYEWEPAAMLETASEADLLGVESALWTETVRTRQDLEYLAFPRVIGNAEIGWSPAAGRGWDEYRERLAAHGPRLAAAGVNFYRSSQIGWTSQVPGDLRGPHT